MKTNDEMDNGRLFSRIHKTWCFPTCGWGCNAVFNPTRRLVSRSKRRYEQDGFNLDLTYITPRIIVHGFPAIGLEHIYRNPRGEILRFMDHYHKDHYKVYNFCCEYGRGYEASVYHGRVERYPFKDHNTPPLNTMHAFATSVKDWLEADDANVVNMHCKAGKGRAGLMCCVALVRTGACQSAADAMALYDKTRVKNNKGLTVVSQRKFVTFYERIWREVWGVKGNIGDVPAINDYILPEEPEYRVYGVEIFGANENNLPNTSVHMYKGTNLAPVFLLAQNADETNPMGFTVDTVIQGNFKVRIDFKKGLFKKSKKAFELWHNTLFLTPDATHCDFNLSEIDLKKKLHKKYGPNLILRIKFTKEELKPPIIINNNANSDELATEGVQLVVRDNVDNTNTNAPAESVDL